MLSQGNAMVDVKPVPNAAPPKPFATPLFGLPLNPAVKCGGCVRFEPINPFTVETGRCRGKHKPGFINREASGCPLHKPKGA